MITNILIDANLIISAFDSDNKDALKKIMEWVKDDCVVLCITPLIRYEVLRGVPFNDDDKYKELQRILNSFRELEIRRNTSELASHLFRYAKYSERKIVDKRSFDVFHCSTAQCNQLEIKSFDDDIAKLNELYNDYAEFKS
ncbi:MAG: PIN domain-containing protein [Cocleimonas sp.]|nr:PIN domain-containing protein [Cocleimonas sp.]